MISLDTFDLTLLAALRRDGRATRQQLSEQIHLSISRVGWHLAQLESKGVIEGYRVVLSPIGLGLGVTVPVGVKLAHHDDAIVERFHGEISLLGAVQECYSVVGDVGYISRVVVLDLPALSELVMHKLVRVPGVDNVRSNIVLTALKRGGALPLSYLGG